MKLRHIFVVVGLGCFTSGQAFGTQPSWDQLPNHIEYVSGGLMSPHVELRIDLETGDYTLTEPAPGKFTLTETRQGRFTREHLDNLIGLAAQITGSGFKTAECQRAEDREAQRRARLQARTHQIVVDHPSMDSQVSFWVRMRGKVETAPRNEHCWTENGKRLYQVMFAAARSDH